MAERGISVVIPLFNKRHTVERAVDSVLRQEGVPFEVVVVDDGSIDGSTDVARKYGNRIRYIQQANAGPSAARNRGVRESRYPIVTFLDADDAYLPGCLQAHMRCREALGWPAVTIVSFQAVGRDGAISSEVLPRRLPALETKGRYFLSGGFQAGLVVNVYIGCIAIDKAHFETVGGFDEALWSWEITDFLMRLCLSTPVMGLLEDVYVSVHDTPGGQSSRTHGKPHYVERLVSKVLDSMERVPEREREFLVKQIARFTYSLWAQGDIKAFKRIGERARPFLGNHGLERRLALLSRLPISALRALHAISAKRRQALPS